MSVPHDQNDAPTAGHFILAFVLCLPVAFVFATCAMDLRDEVSATCALASLSSEDRQDISHADAVALEREGRLRKTGSSNPSPWGFAVVMAFLFAKNVQVRHLQDLSASLLVYRGSLMTLAVDTGIVWAIVVITRVAASALVTGPRQMAAVLLSEAVALVVAFAAIGARLPRNVRWIHLLVIAACVLATVGLFAAFVIGDFAFLRHQYSARVAGVLLTLQLGGGLSFAIDRLRRERAHPARNPPA